jgi:hypothetical protein
MDRRVIALAAALATAPPVASAQDATPAPAPEMERYAQIVLLGSLEEIGPLSAGDWIGRRLFTTRPDEDAERVPNPAAAADAGAEPAELAAVGDVEALVLSPDGRVAAVAVSVGGFLGIGETLVAIPFDRVRMRAGEGVAWLETELTEAELDQVVERARSDRGAGDAADGPADDAAPQVQTIAIEPEPGSGDGTDGSTETLEEAATGQEPASE